MNIDTTLIESKTLNNEQFFVQSQPLIQYGPLSFDQLRQLYINEVIDDNSFIAKSSSLSSLKSSTNKTRTTDTSSPSSPASQVLPNEEQVWSQIRANHPIFSELEDAISSFSKHRPNKYKKRNSDNSNEDESKSKDSKNSSSNVNFKVNMNVNGHNVPTMDMNINISSNDSSDKTLHSTANLNNITRKANESLKYQLKLVEEKNKNLMALNKDLQKQINTLKAKYQSQFVDLKAKMLKQLEEYKKQRQGSQTLLQSEINKLRTSNRNSLQNNVEAKHIIKENEQLSSDNDQLKKKQNKLIDEISEMQLNILYYKTRYKALQSKYDLETFNYDKYHSNITDLKEQILHKQSIIEYHSKIVNSLLKNSISDLIPYQASLTEIEGNHNALTHTKHSIDRNLIRLDALKISELLSWHNYSSKFYLSMDILSEYEGASRRARSRMKNVVSMLGEKVKSLNIHNLTPSELVALSRDLKQSFESISSEQHLKEYELQNQRREFMKDTPMQPKHLPFNMISPLATNMMHRAVSVGTYLGDDNDTNDHGYGISFGSMASLSMMDIQPGNFSRNHSLHSLSPSLDGTESIIAKHRKKSGTIKGSGLKLLTDESTLSQYLDPAKREKELKESHERQKSLSASHHRHASNRSISRSHSHRRIGSSNKRDNVKRNSPVLGPKAPPTSKYGHYSAFTNARLKNSGSNRSTHSTTRSTTTRGARSTHRGSTHRGRSHRHQKNSSISSNKSTSKSTYNLYSKHRSGGHYKNDSINSISSLSRVGDGGNGGSRLQLSDLHESYDDDLDDDDSTVIVKSSPKKDRKIAFDLDNQSGIPMFSPSNLMQENKEDNDADLPKLKEERALSNDILSFFAM